MSVKKAHLLDKMLLAVIVNLPKPAGSAINWAKGESLPSCSSPGLVSLVAAAGRCGERPEK